MTTEPIKFLDKAYNLADLENMTSDQLLELRNLVAANLGVASVKEFKDHNTAVNQTWKALQKYEAEMNDEVAEEAPKAKKAKAPKEPKERGLAKPAEAQFVKRPNMKHFATVKIVKQHTGVEGRGDRWPNYRDGMMVIDAVEGEGTLAWDIYNWQAQGLMEVIMPTEEEYRERRAAWYKKHGRVDPEAEKEAKAEAKAKAKAEREAERAAKAKAREEAKAAKAAE